MSDWFVAEIRIFPFSFAPKWWAFCDGQILPISQNTALFSLLGTNYGGDGRSTFQLPDMQGNVPMHPGQGPGLSPHDLGETGGSDTVSLLASEIPSHGHTLGTGGVASTPSPERAAWGAATAVPNQPLYAAGPGDTAMGDAISPAGGEQPHNNMQPYLTLNFCIALAGVFPPRG
ncbi:MAG: tail fiber protein [Coriobacteriia bacterium]|nr:tail fiber protein [Coriobacteriia bacterium]